MSLHRRTPDTLSLPRHGRAAAAVATLLATALLIAPGMSSATDSSGCTSTWDGGGGTTYWGNAANWSGDRLPGASDVACIGAGAKVDLWSGFNTVAALRSDSPLNVTGGSITITGTAGNSSIAGLLTLGGTGMLVVDGELHADRIVQTGGAFSGRGHLATGDLTWNGGNQGGSGGETEVTADGPGLSLAGDAGRSLGGTRTFRIDPGAQAAWTSGDFELTDSAHLDNAGLLDIRGDQDFVGCCGSGTVINEPGATIRRSSGSGELIFGYALANRGELDLQSGTMTMRSGTPPGGDSTGVFRIARDAALRVEGSSRFANGSLVTGEGPVTFTGGTQEIDGTFEAPLVVDGYAAGVHMSSDQSIPRVDLRRGTIEGAGTISTPEMNWTSGSLAGKGRTVIVPGAGGLLIDHPEGHGIFDRTLEIGAGAEARWLDGNLVMTGSALLDNHGLLDVAADLPASGCCDYSPLVHNAPGGVLRKSSGQGTSLIPYPVRNDGRVEAASGTLAFANAENLANGTLTGGEWLVSATLDLGSGAGVARNAATLILDGPASRVQDASGGDALRGLSANEKGGSLTITGGREIDLPARSQDFENAGAVTIGSGGTLRTGNDFRQTGGTTALTDLTSRLVTAAEGTVDVEGGVLSGPGMVDANVRNAGLITPSPHAGNSGAGAANVLIVTANYVQTADGALESLIASSDPGSGHDRLEIGGSATLAGTLKLLSANGFAPSSQDEFELLHHSSVTGEFDRVDGLNPDPDHSYWPPEYRDDATALRRGSSPAASIGDASVIEGDSGDREARFRISLSEVPGRTVRVAWSTADGSATAPGDYEASHGTVTIPHGESSAVVTVPVHGDAIHEQDETFAVDLSDPAGASIGTGRGTATITDDDPAPDPAGGSEPPSAGDPGPGTTPPTGSTPPPAGHPAPRPPKVRPRARCVDRIGPLSSVARPHPPRAVKRRRMTLRGRARDRGCARVRKVKVAVARSVKVHGRVRCRWLGSRGRFGRRARCDRPHWLDAHGSANWRLMLRRPLARGSYLARSRATDRAGNRELKVRLRGPGGANALRFRVR